MGCNGQCDSCGSAGGCGNQKLADRMNKIKHKVFVMSGKGGVGKSTVAASLALALAGKGAKVGLIDVDFHGPSQPTLFGVQDVRPESDGEEVLPVDVNGIRLFSIGNILDDPDSAIVWRGPAKIGVLKQLLEEVQWGELDYLLFDFPPGTGDEALSACQLVPGEKAAIIVTTPQEVSLSDCRKCLDFCNQVEVPLIGIVENMSGFICPDCGKFHEIFSAGGGTKLAEKAGVPLLAKIPIDPVFLQECDKGNIVEGYQKANGVRDALTAIANSI